MTRERKIFIAVFGCTLLALGADRFLIGGDAGPESVAAATVSQPAAPAPETDGEAVAAPSENPAVGLDVHFARIADTITIDLDGIPDAFAAGAAWPARDEAVVRPTSPLRTPQSFAAAHVLRGVLMSPAGPTAIVDDSALRVGETLDGARLLLIEARAVVFDLEGELATLKLDPVSLR